MVPGAGVEPAQYFYRGILSPLRLPISPPGPIGWSVKFMPYLSATVVLRTTVYHNATRAYRMVCKNFVLPLFTVVPRPTVYDNATDTSMIYRGCG